MSDCAGTAPSPVHSRNGPQDSKAQVDPLVICKRLRSRAGTGRYVVLQSPTKCRSLSAPSRFNQHTNPRNCHYDSRPYHSPEHQLVDIASSLSGKRTNSCHVKRLSAPRARDRATGYGNGRNMRCDRHPAGTSRSVRVGCPLFNLWLRRVRDACCLHCRTLHLITQ